MSVSQYLWSVAKALRNDVHPVVEGGMARDSLDNSIRVLTTLATALAPRAPQSVAAPFDLGPLVDTDRLQGPAENAAAYRDTGGKIAELGKKIEQAGAADVGQYLDAISWEKQLLDAGVAGMDAVEYAPVTAAGGGVQNIDCAALETYLRGWAKAPELRVTEFRIIVGGRSRQTALFSIEGAPSLPPKLVVQRGIPGQTVSPMFVSESGQFELLTALNAAGMRVPRPLLVETAPEALGAAFLIVERSPGAPAQSDYWRPIKDESVALDLAREMALLHAQPIDKLGPKLPQSRERYDLGGWTQELEMQAGLWFSKAHWPSITMSAAIAWMRANVDCLDDRRTLVHNDMIFHNILAEDGKISAVLDWEQTSVGHPGEDLGYCYPVISAATSWDRFLEIYREAGGPPVSQRQIDFFALRGGVRLMNLVLAGGRDSFESGLAQQVLVASAGAHFTQRLLHRIACVLESVLERRR